MTEPLPVTSRDDAIATAKWVLDNPYYRESMTALLASHFLQTLVELKDLQDAHRTEPSDA